MLVCVPETNLCVLNDCTVFMHRDYYSFTSHDTSKLQLQSIITRLAVNRPTVFIQHWQFNGSPVLYRRRVSVRNSGDVLCQQLRCAWPRKGLSFLKLRTFAKFHSILFENPFYTTNPFGVCRPILTSSLATSCVGGPCGYSSWRHRHNFNKLVCMMNIWRWISKTTPQNQSCIITPLRF